VTICWIGRPIIFEGFGRFLVKTDDTIHADVAVLIRGDRKYQRALEVGRLILSGKAECAYLPKALSDQDVNRLTDFGVYIPTEQERNREVLRQLQVPDDRIIMGTRPPGGGTEIEALRVLGMMHDQGFKSAIIVTNWWHTRRVHSIYSRIGKAYVLDFKVVAARGDPSGPSNWWKYRYVSISVIMEYIKLFIHYFHMHTILTFADDPVLG